MVIGAREGGAALCWDYNVGPKWWYTEVGDELYKRVLLTGGTSMEPRVGECTLRRSCWVGIAFSVFVVFYV